MNERIRELDKQARLWAIDNTNFPISSHIPSGYTEKFAELIVRQCAQVAEEVDGDSRARKCVLEHFGVEE